MLTEDMKLLGLRTADNLFCTVTAVAEVSASAPVPQAPILTGDEEQPDDTGTHGGLHHRGESLSLATHVFSTGQ